MRVITVTADTTHWMTDLYGHGSYDLEFEVLSGNPNKSHYTVSNDTPYCYISSHRLGTAKYIINEFRSSGIILRWINLQPKDVVENLENLKKEK